MRRQDGAGFLSKIHSGPRRDVAAAVLFKIPIVRELLLWLGNVNASRKVFAGILEQGMSLMVYTGGEQEQMRSQVCACVCLCVCGLLVLRMCVWGGQVFCCTPRRTTD